MSGAKTVVLIGRKWNNPEITITVSNEAIGITQQLVDFIKALAVESDDSAWLTAFIKALAAEYGNPATTMTVASHEQRLLAAAEAVIKGAAIPGHEQRLLAAAEAVIKGVKAETPRAF